MTRSISKQLEDRFGIVMVPGGHGQCPYCRLEQAFIINCDDTFGKCLNSKCAGRMTASTGQRGLDDRNAFFVRMFNDFRDELHRMKKATGKNAYRYVVEERRIHKQVVGDSMIGAVPAGYEKVIGYPLFLFDMKEAVDLAKSARQQKGGKAKDQLTYAELEFEILEEHMNMLRYHASSKVGWLVFFYTDHMHRITSIRFREPYTKNVRLFKPFDSTGISGHDPFAQSAGDDEKKPDNRFIVTEGEFNLLQLQSARLRYLKNSGKKPDYVHACAVGSASGPDFKTIRQITREPIICFDNDDAGRKMVEKAQQSMSFEAFTTPKPKSALDEFFLSYGKKPKAAWKAYCALLENREFCARFFDSIAFDVGSIRNGKGKAHQINKTVAHEIKTDLQDRGKFFHDGNTGYFFEKGSNRLIEIHHGNKNFNLLMDSFGINLTEDIHRYVAIDLWSHAIKHGTKIAVHHLGHYCRETYRLYVFNHANQIYRISSNKIELVDNGTDGVLFLSNDKHEPFNSEERPVKGDPLNETIIGGINFSEDVLSPDERKLLLKYWIYSLFFMSILPTKPILAFVGEKGSGKSLTLRLIGKLLFGQNFDVTPVSTDVKDFDAAITNAAFLAIDNADNKISWLNDRLATVATGGSIKKRNLYTTNDLVEYPINCFVAITSRTPEFRRDDVADRLLIMKVARIQHFVPESEMLNGLLAARNQIWSQLILRLQEIVVALEKAKDTKGTGTHRMADFFNFCIQVARADGNEKMVESIFNKLGKEQSQFTLENEPVFDLLVEWVKERNNSGRWVTNKTLCGELDLIARMKGGTFSYANNPRGFSQKMSHLRVNLEEFFDISDRTKGAREKRFAFKLKESETNPKKSKAKKHVKNKAKR